MANKFASFFDKLEDRIRIKLSHYPIVYSLIGGVGIVLFWKGIWETAESFPILYGPMSILLSLIILLATGLLVSFFIGDNIILSGYRREKKLIEKTENEVRLEEVSMELFVHQLNRIEKQLAQLAERPRIVRKPRATVIEPVSPPPTTL